MPTTRTRRSLEASAVSTGLAPGAAVARGGGTMSLPGGDSYAPLFLRAQKRVERRHYRQRLDLMNYERQRQEILKDLGADPYVD